MTTAPKSYPLRGGKNALLTVSLFLEPWQSAAEQFRAEGITPIFSLNGRDGYVDAHQTFVDLKDPTGVLWAEMWLEGVNHLNRLLKCDWFRDAFDSWAEEITQVMQAEALRKIREISEGEGPAAFQASKYIAGRDWQKSPRGRPSKAAVTAEARAIAQQNGEHAEDLDRITTHTKLKVVK